MAKKPLPSAETLRQLLRYEPETGKLFWKERGPEWFGSGTRDAVWVMRRWNSTFAASEALTNISANGYRNGSILGKNVLAHRAIWALHHVSWPDHHLDHINRDRLDNRLENLRLADHFENTQNAKARSGSSMFKGVGIYKRNMKWQARIQCDGIRRCIGFFECEVDAARAYDVEAIRLHGEYAVLNFGGRNGAS